VPTQCGPQGLQARCKALPGGRCGFGFEPVALASIAKSLVPESRDSTNPNLTSGFEPVVQLWQRHLAGLLTTGAEIVDSFVFLKNISENNLTN